MQAYYGPGVTMPSQYFTATVSPGHVSPYMWAPQPLRPAFVTPYAAIYYPHGGVYSHSLVPLGSHSQGIPAYSTTTEAVVVTTPLSTGTPKPSNNKDRGLLKKLKGVHGLALPKVSGNTENTGGDMNGLLQSEENGVEGSSGGSDGNTKSGGNKTHKKRGSGNTQTSGNGKSDTLVNAIDMGEEKASSDVPEEVTLPAADIAGKSVSKVASLSPIPTRMDFRFSSSSSMKEERELKRERRKQSNRESARRSRLRKQAETAELALKVEALEIENMNLRSEITQLKENSAKLRSENSSLMDWLKDPQLERAEIIPNEEETQIGPSTIVTNCLSRIDNSISMIIGQKDEAHEKSGMLHQHQLFNSSPLTDAVAAG